MRRKYKRILYFIAFLILACVVLGVSYLFYDHVINVGTEVEIVEELSINYIDGKMIDDNRAYTFSITNNSANDVYYDIVMENLKNYDSKVGFNLVSTDGNIDISNTLNRNTNVLVGNLLIPKGATQNFTFALFNNKMTSFKLTIRKTTDSKEYFYMTLLENNPVGKDTLTKIGDEVAVGNEGLIEDFDDLGNTYYFRGNIANNYVKFADNIWRIVRINGDGTVKMILNSSTGELTSFNDTLEGSEDIENTSIIKALNVYYEIYLQNYDNYIAAHKFCIDSLNNGATNKIYNAYNRIVTDKIPTFNCLGSSYSSKIGLLSADEAIYAGASTGEENKKYYLYNADLDNVWWTSTLALASETDFKPFAINTDGRVVSNVSGLLFRHLRPVISLNRKVTVTGDGSIENPYIPTLEQ